DSTSSLPARSLPTYTGNRYEQRLLFQQWAGGGFLPPLQRLTSLFGKDHQSSLTLKNFNTRTGATTADTSGPRIPLKNIRKDETKLPVICTPNVRRHVWNPVASRQRYHITNENHRPRGSSKIGRASCRERVQKSDGTGAY